MGWTFFNRPAGKDARAILEERCLTWRRPPEAHPKVVGHTQNGRVHAFAVRFPAAFFEDGKPFDGYTPDLDGAVTSAVVFLTKSSAGEFGYKDMGETMGPYEVVKSGAFLDLLSPTTVEYAANWRARCREAIAVASKVKQIADGTRISFSTPLLFANGDRVAEFTAGTLIRFGRKRRVYFAGGVSYRIPTETVATATIL